MATNFVSYANATALFTEVGNKLRALNGAYVVKGNSAFASLPATPTRAQSGYVYNVTDDFTTDARFVEGAGKKYPAGTNVVIADLTTVSYDAVTPSTGSENPKTEGWYESDGEGGYVLTDDTEIQIGKTYYTKTETVSVKYDVIGSFVDVDGINNRIDTAILDIAPEFDNATAYEVGDIVTYEDVLYQCTTAHAAGDWDSTNFTATDVKSLIAAVAAELPEELTTAQVNALKALLD